MRNITVKQLAEELGISVEELKKRIFEDTGKKVKANDKLEDEIVELLRMTFPKPEEKVQHIEEEKKEGVKAFDLYHELGISIEELSSILRELGNEQEISNFSIIEKEYAEKVRQKVAERRKVEQEKKPQEEKPPVVEEVVAKQLEEKPEEKTPVVEQPVMEKKEPEKEQEEEVVIEGLVTEEKRYYKKEKFHKKYEERKPREEKRDFKERKPFEKREEYKKPFEKKEPYKKPFHKKEEKIEEKKEEKRIQKEERFTAPVLPQSIKEEKKPEKKETKEERELRLKEEKEEMEALRKLMEGHQKKKKPQKKEKKEEQVVSQEEEIKIVSIPEVITVRELADLLDIPVNQILMDLLQRKILATVNQTIDPKIALEIAESHGFLAEIKVEGEEEETEKITEEVQEESEENLVERPPIVTVMGHVDHGKTTLLDTIRKTDVAAKEHGGITQHIGAYKIKLPNGKEITFLDTPGHEAFTTLRARGSKVADIAVLVVAADDGVKPQTVEAINHAKNANVPIIVAVNKIDKPGADPLRVRQELTQYNLIPEEWGGDTIFVDISAKTGKNVEELLEMILLVAEMQGLKANPNRLAIGTVIESKLDPKKGPVATVLVENGTLHVGDYFVAGYSWGKVKALFNERGERLKSATPGTPVEVLGFDEVPSAGDKFIVKATEREAKQLAEVRKQKREEELLAKKTRIHLENLSEVKEINLIIKADVQGSLEALKKSIEDLSSKFNEVSINIIHAAVGPITESDVMLAAASNAIIIGFNVRPDVGARKAAEEENIDIKLYNIIYQAIEDLEMAMKGMLAPTLREVLLGVAEVRQTFKAKSIGTIAGCYVLEGVIKRNAKARLVRNGVVIYDGEISSLKRFKDDVKEVQRGFECGLTLKNFNDIKVGDQIEAYEIVEERAI